VELALGTVQMGLAYGVAGRGEAVPAAEAEDILECAWENGIRVLDTAPVYGDIEERLVGLMRQRAFNVVSKIPPLPDGVDATRAGDFVRAAVERSRQRLGSRLGTLLFHRATDLLGPTAAPFDAARDAAGTAVRIGVSCYSPREAVAVRERVPVEAVQLPGNALDQRLAQSGVAESLQGVEVHLRSAFLQGLLLMPLDLALRRVPLAAAALARWQQYCRARALSPLAAALGAARQLPGVRYCVVGVDRVQQLEEICVAWRDSQSPDSAALACDDERVIDPRLWAAA
jgi:aryl-alcohol dehydrogenase-like predicted oxidoreductase